MGVGTTFRVHLPAGGGPVRHVSAALHDLLRGEGERILFVDDKPDIVSVNGKVLTDAGYRVVATVDPLDAVARIEATGSEFALVITDLDIPGRTGLELAREVARLQPDLPVVLTSGLVIQEVRDQARAVGVQQVLPKPYGMLELIDVVYQLRRRFPPVR